MNLGRFTYNSRWDMEHVNTTEFQMPTTDFLGPLARFAAVLWLIVLQLKLLL